MAHGTKPYGRTTPDNTIFGMADLGELAARLFSPDTFDRRGNVMWMDNFDSGIEAWHGTFTGAGGSVIWSPEHHRSGGFAVLLTPGNLDDDTAMISHFMPYPILSRFGFEFSFTWDAQVDLMDIYMGVYTGTRNYYSGIQIDNANNDLNYLSAPLTWTKILDLPALYALDYHFHTAKLVVDFTTLFYSRFTLNDVIYNLTAIPVLDIGLVAPTLMYINVEITSDAAGLQHTWIDDVIVTQNEP